MHPSSMLSPVLSVYLLNHTHLYASFWSHTCVYALRFDCSKAVRQFGEVRNGHKFKRPPSKQCIVRYKATAAAWQQAYGQHQRSGTLPAEISSAHPSWLFPMPERINCVAWMTAVRSPCIVLASAVRRKCGKVTQASIAVSLCMQQSTKDCW